MFLRKEHWCYSSIFKQFSFLKVVFFLLKMLLLIRHVDFILVTLVADSEQY